MKKQWGILLGAGLLFSSSVYPAYAYEWRGIQVLPLAGLTETYDSNITSVAENELSDLRTDASAGVGLVYEDKTTVVNLDTLLTQQMFIDHTEFDNTVISLHGRYKREFSKYSRLTVDDSFSRAESPTTFNDAFGTTNGRYTRDINNFSMEYWHEVNSQLAWRSFYGNVLANYPAEILSDSATNTFGTGLDYSFSSSDIVSLDYELTLQDFTPGASSRVNEVAANYRHFLTSRLYSDLGLGVDLINDFEGNDKSYPLFRAALTQDTDENTRISITLDKKHAVNSDTADVYNNWRLAGSIIKQLKERLQAIGSIFYGKGKHVTRGGASSLAGIDAGISYELMKNASLRAGYRFEMKNIINESGDYTKNTIYCGITYKF